MMQITARSSDQTSHEEKDMMMDHQPPLQLPPGFRFHPLDHELLEHYLARKIADANFKVMYIGDIDLNRCEPWDLPGMAMMGEKEWYFFALRDRKYPTGKRTNRATEAGYWKATGKDKEVTSARSSRLLGMKKTLVFYRGRAPRGEKTNWIMHEYRSLESDHSRDFSSPKDSEWVICRIYKKTPGGKKVHIKDMQTMNKGYYDQSETLNALPPLESPPQPTASKEPEFDSDVSRQDDLAVGEFRSSHDHYQSTAAGGAYPSAGFRSTPSDFWEPSLHSAPAIATDHMTMHQLYFYDDIYNSNQQFSEGCLPVNSSTCKTMQGSGPSPPLAPPPFFPYTFDPLPAKGHSDQIPKAAAMDYPLISRHCKTEPHDNGGGISDDPLGGSHSTHRITMDQNNLLTENAALCSALQDIAGPHAAKDLSPPEIRTPYSLFQSNSTSSWWM